MKPKIKIGGFIVHPIGIGTWSVGGWFKPNYDHDEKEIVAIRYSLDKGQNHIDTAEMYADGHAEEVVGKAIKEFKREKLFIASKVYKNHTGKKDVVIAVEKMLRRLGTDYLDLVYIHSPNNISPLEVYMDGINESVDKGLMRYIGVSKFDLIQLKKALALSKHGISALQNLFNVGSKEYLDRGLRDFCSKNHITIVAHSPLANCTRLKPVLQLAEKYKRTPYQIALNWLISQDNVVTIPKSINRAHIDENLGALDFKLSKDDFELLDSI